MTSIKLSEYTSSQVTKDLPLCRYMELDAFIRMLKTEQMYVRRKMFYEDPFEKNPPMDEAYRTSPCGENTSPQPKKEERRKSIDAKYAEWAAMPTSCWTLDTQDNYLMWKAYAPNMGIRIISSVSRIISSFHSDSSFSVEKCTIHFGKMKYSSLNKEEQTALWKNRAYKGEREFRFYFDIQGDCCNLRECCSNKGVSIPIDTKKLIKEVAISPFVNYVVAKEIEAILRCRYEIKHIKPIKLR